MKLIKINTDHYIVVDNSLDFSETDYYWDDKQKEIRTGSNNHVTGGYKIKITHSTQPLESLKIDSSVANIQKVSWGNIKYLPFQEIKELIGEVDIEKKAETLSIKQNGVEHWDWQNGFKVGYNQALEDNKERKYTEEDMRKAIEFGYQLRCNNRPINSGHNWVKDFIAQSLQPKTKWEVEFINGKLTLKQ